MKTNVQIGIETKASDVSAAVDAFRRLGVAPAEAAQQVEKLVEATKTSGGKVAAAMLEAAAAVNRFAGAAENGSSRAGRAGEQAAFKMEQLRDAIAQAQAAGSPIDESALATLREFDAQMDGAIRKVAQYKNVQDDVRDATIKSRSETDLQRGSVNDLGDILEKMGPKWAGIVGATSAAIGAFAAGYAATRKLIEGLKEYLDIDVDGWVQKTFRLQGIADWIVGVDNAAGAADRLRNAQNILRHQGIDPTGKSLEELDRLLEENSRKTTENKVKVEEAAKAAAEAYRERVKAAKEWVAAEIDGLNAVTAANARFRDQLEKLMLAMRNGGNADELLRLLDKFQAAWAEGAGERAFIEPPEIDPEPIREYGKAAAMSADELEKLTGWITDMVVEQAESVTLAKDWHKEALGWLAAIDMAGEAIGDFNSELGRGIQQAAQLAANVIQAYQAWKASGSKQGFTAEGMMGGMATGQQVGAMGQSFGWWSGDRGKSGFGGRMSGDYGDTGSMVGGIVGSFLGPIGALVGSLIGGVLGGLIKKGADEGLGELRQTLTGVAMMVGKNEGGLGDLLADVGTAIDQSLRAMLDELGGKLESIPEVSFKIRDNTVTVWVGAVKGVFKDLQEATAFALQEILRQGEISGIGEAVKKALEGSYGKSLEQLAADLDFAQYVDNLGLDEVALAIQEQLRGFGAAMRKAIDLGFGTDQIVAELGRGLSQIRNQILGISESEDERIRRQAASFNAELALMRAEQEAKLVDLRLQEASLQAEVAIQQAEAGVTKAGIEIGQERVRNHAAILEVEAGILQAEGEITRGKVSLLAAALVQLEAVQAAIAAAGELLANLPALISPEEIEAAIRGIGGGGGGSVGGGSVGPSPADRLKDFERALADLRSQALPDFLQRLREVRERFAELRATAVELGQSTEELDRLEEQRLETLRNELTTSLRGFQAGGGDAAGWQRQLDDISAWFGEALDAAAAAGIDLSEVYAAFQGRVSELRDAILSALSPTYAASLRITNLGKSLDWLRDHADELGLSLADVDRIIGEVGQSFFLDAAERMARMLGDQELLAELEEMRFDMEKANLLLEIELARERGIIDEAAYQRLMGIFANLPDDLPGIGGTGGTGPRIISWQDQQDAQQAAANALLEAARRMREAIDRLIDFQRSLFLSDLSPLTGQQRLDTATNQAQALVQQILGMAATNPQRTELMNQLPDMLRAYLQELGSFWGTSSAQYAAGFAWVNQVLNQLTGGNVLPFPAGNGGGQAGGGNTVSGGTNAAALMSPATSNVLPFQRAAAASSPAADEMAGRLAQSNNLLARAVAVLESIERKTAAADTATKRAASGATR